MSINLIDLIKGQLGPAFTSQTAQQLGESESGISKAVSGLLPAVLGGLANNSDNPSVLDAITGAGSVNSAADLSGNVQGSSWITTLLKSIFGDKLSTLINSVATYAGISSNSAESLLNLVTGATAGSVAQYAQEQNLDRSGISNLLNDQKGLVSGLLPAGLSLASLNLGNWAKGYGFEGNENPATTPPKPEPHAEVTRSVADSGTFPDRNNNNEGGSIWKWLLPLLLLLAAAFFVWKQCEKKETTVTTTTNDSTGVKSDTVVSNSNDTMNAPSETRTDESIDLNGTSLMGYKGGMEDQMISFLKAGSYASAADDAALKDTWYSFDHVNFKIGSSTELEAGSQGQIDNLVAILKAFPDAKIKIGGYTDKTGVEADNIRLSTARANFIKSALDKAGVGAQILGAEGYGSKFATVAKEASNEERAADRKMAIRFAK
ncbi:flagellar motor protein MotB [Chryseobacterium sp. Leaf404]|uniref:OmpA family protein n=1 Tax=unclassified Chryseobacterium TaxID=2593645 RepID=UPI0006F99B66|nr:MULTISPECIES: OmpA family protein [unclassified Chryseobacterium]KQT17138.1 flagellar motor protein MotB [Chryseobacterium sp. Leaf404]